MYIRAARIPLGMFVEQLKRQRSTCLWCVCAHGGSWAEGHFTVETLRLDLKALISRLGGKDIQGTL